MKEQNLFGTLFDSKDNIGDSVAQLAQYVNMGYTFLRPIEVSNILGITLQGIRNEVKLYKLDAYHICGHLRITTNAVQDYLDKVYLAETNIARNIENQAFSGVYELNKEGKLDTIKKEIIDKGLPVTIIDDLLLKDYFFHYDQMSQEQPYPLIDWYGIDTLPIPEEMYVFDLANLLRVSKEQLASELGKQVFDQIDYPSVYDYLTVKQLLNMDIPFSLNISQKLFNNSGQLFLDL